MGPRLKNAKVRQEIKGGIMINLCHIFDLRNEYETNVRKFIAVR